MRKPTPNELFLHGDAKRFGSAKPKAERKPRGTGPQPKIHMEHEGLAACRRRGFFLEKTTDRSKVDCANCRLVMFNWRDEK